MTHKAQCIEYCKGYLSTLSLLDIFSLSLFESYYRKFNGSIGNAYTVGLHAADYIILNTNIKQELS